MMSSSFTSSAKLLTSSSNRPSKVSLKLLRNYAPLLPAAVLGVMCKTIMEVSKVHEIDCGEQDEDGYYDWYYEYDLYEFSFGSIKLHARSYSDTPKEVSFFAYEKDGKRSSYNNNLIEQPEFLEALKYLKNLGTYEKYCFFNGSYPVVPLSVWRKLENT